MEKRACFSGFYVRKIIVRRCLAVIGISFLANILCQIFWVYRDRLKVLHGDRLKVYMGTGSKFTWGQAQIKH